MSLSTLHSCYNYITCLVFGNVPKIMRFLGGPNTPNICVRGTKFNFKDWAPRLDLVRRLEPKALLPAQGAPTCDSPQLTTGSSTPLHVHLVPPMAAERYFPDHG